MFRNADGFIDSIINKYGNQQLDNMLNGIENEINVDILYYPDINEYMGKITIQAVISNYRFN